VCVAIAVFGLGFWLSCLALQRYLSSSASRFFGSWLHEGVAEPAASADSLRSAALAAEPQAVRQHPTAVSTPHLALLLGENPDLASSQCLPAPISSHEYVHVGAVIALLDSPDDHAC
jgi:hypothetical protein